MIRITQKVKDYFQKRKAVSLAEYIDTYKFDELQFDFIHREINHPIYTCQAELVVDERFYVHPGHLTVFLTEESREANQNAELHAREILSRAELKEGKDFFVGSYVNDEILSFGVLMVQAKDPKTIMILKLAF